MKRIIIYILLALSVSLSYSQDIKSIGIEKIECKLSKEKNDLEKLRNTFYKIDLVVKKLRYHNEMKFDKDYNKKYINPFQKDYIYRGWLYSSYNNDAIEIETILEDTIQEYNELYEYCYKRYSWTKKFPSEVIYFFRLENFKFTPIIKE
jgi:hypothetical protein